MEKILIVCVCVCVCVGVCVCGCLCVCVCVCVCVCGRGGFLDPIQFKKYQNKSRCGTDYDQKVIWS